MTFHVKSGLGHAPDARHAEQSQKPVPPQAEISYVADPFDGRRHHRLKSYEIVLS